MKKFTDKQIATFLKMINDGILYQIDTNDQVIIIDSILEEEGTDFLAKCNISTNSLIDIADECGELGYLAEQAAKTYSERYPSNKKEAPLEQLREILSLRDWAGKNEIINELNLVL